MQRPHVASSSAFFFVLDFTKIFYDLFTIHLDFTFSSLYIYLNVCALFFRFLLISFHLWNSPVSWICGSTLLQCILLRIISLEIAPEWNIDEKWISVKHRDYDSKYNQLYFIASKYYHAQRNYRTLWKYFIEILVF